jgi:lantibiotic transport system permease protein
VGSLEPSTLKNPWGAFFMTGLRVFGFCLLPMYGVLACTLLPQTEFRNNTWKQVLASPQSKAALYLSKFVVVHLYILLCVVSFVLLMLSGGGLAQLARPEIAMYTDRSNWEGFFITLGNIYVGILGVSALQFWLGTRCKNFIAPVGIGFGMWMFTAMMLFELKWEHADKIPYAYPILSVFPRPDTTATVSNWSSFAYALLFLVLGYIDFTGKAVKA